MPNQDEILDLKVAVDIRDSLKAIEKFNREMVNSMRDIAQASERMGKTAERAASAATEASEDQTAAVKETTKALKEEQVAVEDLGAAVEETAKKSKKAAEADKKAQAEALKRMQQRRKRRGLDQTQGFMTRDQQREARSQLSESGNALVEPLRSFLSRDAKGLIEASAKGFGRIFSREGAKAMALGGASIKQQGAVLSAAGRRRGGVVGGAMRLSGAAQGAAGGLMGGAGKALGGLTKALAPLSKIVPIFGMLGSSLMALVKLFIDADSMVKEFNKGILDSASTIEYMSTYGSQSMSVLEKDLESLGKAATDASFNNALGITKDQHTAIINVLTQEGVSLGYLSRQAKASGKDLGELSQSIVASGVAYSRALGVPLQEVNQLQAEMITEMGSSIQDTEMAFASMTRAAGESGIAGNKFFQMIKGVSQDLSVWNMRMEDSVDLLGRMTKVMSPRSAQKFFQEMSSGFSQLGRQDLLKQAIIAGAGATKEANQGTLARMQKELTSTLGVDVKGKGFNEIYKLIQSADIDASQRGTMMERLNQMETVRKGMRGGTYGQAYATRHADTAGQLKILEAALEKFGGTIEDPSSMAIGSAADALGKSPEFVEALASLARTAKAERERRLENAANDPAELAKIQAMTNEELINELGEEMMPKSDEEIRKQALEASKKQGQMTQDLMSKFNNFVDNFMVQFYYLVMDIYEVLKNMYKVVASLFGDDFDKGKRAGGIEGSRLMGMLGSDQGVKKVGEVISKQFSGESFMKLLKTAGVSEDKQSAIKKSLRNSRGTKKAGQYDALALLKSAGVDPKQVFGKALWERDSRKQSDAFVDALGISATSLPQMRASAAPETLTGKSIDPEAEAKKSAVTAEAVESTAKTAETQLKVMKTQGVNISPKGAKGIGDEMLTALRKALYEYYLYSGSDRAMVSSAFGSGGPTAGALSALTQNANMPLDSVFNKMAEARRATPNASGGLVTGIANGMAVVAAQGEGLASVGKGEKIVPAGGGGGVNINIPVSGVGARDLANLIEGKVVEGIREYKRREKLT